MYEEYSYNGGETLEARYIYGDDYSDDVKLMMRTESSELDKYYYFHKNSLGSIVAVTDDNENLAEQYSYDPFGIVYMKDGQGTSITSSAIKNPYLFTGRRFDEEIDKYYYRMRHFDPDTGRFLQRDPAGYVEGTNLYEYTSSNPINYIDPYGMESHAPFGKSRDHWGTFAAGGHGCTFMGTHLFKTTDFLPCFILFEAVGTWDLNNTRILHGIH